MVDYSVPEVRSQVLISFRIECPTLVRIGR